MLSAVFGSPLPAGTKAPDFTLASQTGELVTLSNLRGRNVVLVFYPRDETPVCRKQLCEFRDVFPQASAKNTVVFGVNPGRAESHAGFHEHLGLPFPLLIDEGRKVARLYHAKGLLLTIRTVYLIGPDGSIRYSRRGKPDPAEVLAAAV